MIRTIGYDLRAMEESLERLFGGSVKPAEKATTVIPIDIIERNNTLMVNAALPGVDPANVTVSIEENVLTLQAENEHSNIQENDKLYRREVSFGRFTRSIRLPDGLNHDAIAAEFKNGLLTVTIPRAEDVRPKVRKIEVRSGNALELENVEPNS